MDDTLYDRRDKLSTFDSLDDARNQYNLSTVTSYRIARKPLNRFSISRLLHSSPFISFYLHPSHLLTVSFIIARCWLSSKAPSNQFSIKPDSISLRGYLSESRSGAKRSGGHILNSNQLANNNRPQNNNK